MTAQKKFKQAIRSRARKTGESYTSARHHVLKARQKRGSAAPAPELSRPAAAKKPTSSGAVSETAIVKKTGHGLDHWFAVLDAFGASDKGHTAAADHLYSAHAVPGWHAQGITVAYERARGLRSMNQSCTGKFQVSVSRVVPASVATVADAFADARRRAAWLAAEPRVAKAVDAAFSSLKPPQMKTKGAGYAWLRIPWDGSTVEIRITGKPKGDGTSVVADNKNLASPEQVESRRAQWRDALEALKRHLSR